jgi:hypothetical protein
MRVAGVSRILGASAAAARRARSPGQAVTTFEIVPHTQAQLPSGPLPWISSCETVTEGDGNHAVPQSLSSMANRHASDGTILRESRITLRRTMSRHPPRVGNPWGVEVP